MKLQPFLWPLSGQRRRQVDLVLLFKKSRTTSWISRRICRNRAIYERVLSTNGTWKNTKWIAQYTRIINCQRSTKLMILEHCCSISLFLSKRTRLSCQWLPLDVGAFEGLEKKKAKNRSRSWNKCTAVRGTWGGLAGFLFNGFGIFLVCACLRPKTPKSGALSYLFCQSVGRQKGHRSWIIAVRASYKLHCLVSVRVTGRHRARAQEWQGGEWRWIKNRCHHTKVQDPPALNVR